MSGAAAMLLQVQTGAGTTRTVEGRSQELYTGATNVENYPTIQLAASRSDGTNLPSAGPTPSLKVFSCGSSLGPTQR
jgi:hypothetical protein